MSKFLQLKNFHFSKDFDISIRYNRRFPSHPSQSTHTNIARIKFINALHSSEKNMNKTQENLNNIGVGVIGKKKSAETSLCEIIDLKEPEVRSNRLLKRRATMIDDFYARRKTSRESTNKLIENIRNSQNSLEKEEESNQKINNFSSTVYNCFRPVKKKYIKENSRKLMITSKRFKVRPKIVYDESNCASVQTDDLLN